MTTRVGPYIFDIDLDEMSIEKLQFLRSGCDHAIQQKQIEKLFNEFTELNLRAHALGFNLCFVNPDDSDDVYILNQFNFEVKERDDI